MSASEKVQEALQEVDYMLAYKWITTPVRQMLTTIKGLLESIQSELGS
tara:strand:+ start:2454 stop:2597 length:144 start_codon:yes stop_codon:yes gene_type:complete